MDPNQGNGPRYLNTQEAAAHLNLSQSWLQALRVKGGGPQFIKIGRRVLYEIALLDAFARERSHSSTSQYGLKGE
jgi:hypothetical protein